MSHRNEYTLELEIWEDRFNILQWLGFDRTLGVDPSLRYSKLFQKISRLEVHVIFYDPEENPLLIETCALYRETMYDLVDLIHTRVKPLALLFIWCDWKPLVDNKPPRLYQPDTSGAAQLSVRESNSQEQPIMEPLANLKGAADELKFRN